jgi:hypothetical protein
LKILMTNLSTSSYGIQQVCVAIICLSDLNCECSIYIFGGHWLLTFYFLLSLF